MLTTRLLLLLSMPLPAVAAPDSCDAFGPVTVSVPTEAADTSWTGLHRNDRTGHGVVHAGDLDGDGWPDLVISSPGDASQGPAAGSVSIFFGPIAPGQDLSPVHADAQLFGSAYERAGWSIAAAGDVDLDGFDDLLIGSWPTSRAADPQGRVWLIRGGPQLSGSLDLATQADATVLGLTEATFGTVVSGAGDLNGDGFGDVMIGAPRSHDDLGAVHVFHGPILGPHTVEDADTSLIGTSPRGRLGVAMAAVGDLDQDGLDDVLLGAPRTVDAGPLSGSAYLVPGASDLTGSWTIADAAESTLVGNAYDRLGTSLAVAGDVDEDGHLDLWIGAKQWGATKRGAVHLIHWDSLPAGRTRVDDVADATLRGLDAGDLFGTAIAGDVDLNADGIPDVVVGASHADGSVNRTGAAWALLGPFSGAITVQPDEGRYWGSHDLALAGTAVAVFDDLNGDGFGDVIVGSPGADAPGARRAGHVGLFYGGEDVLDLTTWFADGDGDSWGDANTTQDACEAPQGYVRREGDCRDDDATIHPFALELDCSDPVDRNCDGSVGPVDADLDGIDACRGDCADHRSDVSPDRSEVCGDGIDNDCDGATDDGTANDALVYYPDADGDGFGRINQGIRACEVPSYFLTPPVWLGGDCNDRDPAIRPGAPETCDGVDNNCDDRIDEDSALDADTWFADLDGDGFGDRHAPQTACERPDDYTDNAQDCDDDDHAVHPGATEICDARDNDCDGIDYLGGPTVLEHPHLTLQGAAVRSHLGSAVAIAPDMDGDGLDELVVGAPRESTSTDQGGAVYVRNGSPLGGSFAADVVLADGSSHWDARIRFAAPGVQLGSTLETGDWNGDGLGDIAVAAVGAAAGELSRGVVLIYFGPVRGDLDDLDADVRLTGASRGDRLGHCLAGGDLDDDGRDDLVLGAPGTSDGGTAYVVYGDQLRTAKVHEVAAAHLEGQPGDRLGSACALTGDLDDDGLVDIAVGAPESQSQAGYVAFVQGQSGRLSGALTSSALITGMRTADRLGLDLRGGQDVSGDGVADLLIGTGNNEAHLILGGEAPISDAIERVAAVTLTGTLGQRAGARVAMPGDVDGDGIADLVLGLDGDDGLDGATPEGGAALLVYGGSLPRWVDVAQVESRGRDQDGVTFAYEDIGGVHGARLLSADAGASLGAAVGGGGDLNGDGRPDLVLGAPDASDQRGKALVISAGPYGLDVSETLGGALELSQTTFYVDEDADGQGATPAQPFRACPFHVPVDHDGPHAPGRQGVADLADVTDCDDTNPFAYVGAPERDGDGVDSDCDGFDSANQLPHLIVRLGPEDPHTDSTLEAFVEVIDPEAGTMDETPISLNYRWTVNGIETGTTDPTLDGTVWFARDDVVSVLVTADDGRGVTDVFTWSTTIDNGAPWLHGLAITPAAPTMVDEVYVTWVHEDPDIDDIIEVDCEWTVQWFDPFGTEHWNDLQAQHTEHMGRCDTIRNCEHHRWMRARCRPWDGRVWGPWATSPEFMIFPSTNTTPVAETCAVSPASPDTRDNLTATPTGVDRDGDPITWTYTWSINGAEVPGQTTATLDQSLFSRDDAVRATCTPADPTGPGVSASSSVTIANLPPTQPTLALSAAAGGSAMVGTPITTEHDLLCSVAETATDPDNDVLSYQFAWRVDGVAWPGSADTSLHPGDTIPAAALTQATWTCEAWASDGDADSSTATTEADVLPGETRAPPRHLVAGDDANCMLTDDAQVICWGEGTAGKLGNGRIEDIGDESGEMEDNLQPIDFGAAGEPISIDLAQDFGCAIFDDGRLKCWGKNASGQLGLGHASDMGNDPAELGDALPFVDVGTGRTVAQVDANFTHTCARLDNGQVKCWGSGSRGQLGHEDWDALGDQAGEMGDALQPVALGTGRSAVDIAVGTEFSCALLDDDTVKCWGLNNDGQLGMGHTIEWGDDPGEMGDALPPIDLGSVGRVIDIEAGAATACARFEDGRMKCWGANTHGQAGQGHADGIGDDPGEMGDALPFIDLGAGRSVRSMGVGQQFTCALLDDASVKCFGRAQYGQLGSGDDRSLGDDLGEMGDNLLPLDLSSHLEVQALAVGYTHACTLFTCGQIKCWGGNVKGELGQADFSPRGDQPHQMGDLLPVVPLGSWTPADLDPPATCPYSHRIEVDGDDSDWASEEIFATSSGGTTATMVSWDDTFVYIGVRHAAVGTDDNDHTVHVYFGNGQDGTGAFSAMSTGIRIAPQEPGLPFWSQAALQWRSDDLDDAYFWADTYWGRTTWEEESFYMSIWGTGDSTRAFDGAEVLELRVQREDLRLYDQMKVHVSWGDDTYGAEQTFGATPASSITEGDIDPTFGAYLAFDLTAPDGPAVAEVRGAD